MHYYLTIYTHLDRLSKSTSGVPRKYSRRYSGRVHHAIEKGERSHYAQLRRICMNPPQYASRVERVYFHTDRAMLLDHLLLSDIVPASLHPLLPGMLLVPDWESLRERHLLTKRLFLYATGPRIQVR